MDKKLSERKEIMTFIETQLNDPKQTFILSTLTADGYPDSRIMGNICDKSLDEVYFTCKKGTRKIEELAHNTRASVYFTFGEKTAWLYGEAVCTQDEKVRMQLWNDRMLPIYPNGAGSPELTIIKFTTKRIRFRSGRSDYVEFEV